MKKPCPICGDLCDPVTDEHDNPFRRVGLGTAYFCEGCGKHWYDGMQKRRRALLEEQPAPEH